MSVRIIATGGTFEKAYDEINGTLIFKSSLLKGMIQRARCTLPIELEQIMMIDSLEMTLENRQKILKSCTDSSQDRIVITHGTDTMQETAAFIAKAEVNKTIVLTGALVPYSFGSSDAFFNLGTALAFTQCLESGVYISMNGQYWSWDEVAKNKKTGYFEPI